MSCQTIQIKKASFDASNITNFNSAVCAVVTEMSSYSVAVEETDPIFSALSSTFLQNADFQFVALSGDVMYGSLSAPTLSTDTLYVGASTIYFTNNGIVVENLKSKDVTTLKEISANWNSVYSSYNGQSANNFNVYTTVISNSANWNIAYSLVNLNNVKWSSVYTVVNANSANWSYAYTLINTYANSWTQTYNLVYGLEEDSSGYITWDSTYNTVGTTSARWFQTLSYDSLNNLLRITDGNAISLSAISDPITILQSTSANWDSNYTTVNANSATWAIDTDTIYDDSLLQSTSANWDSNYTTVNANSANWSDPNIDLSDYLALTGGTISGDLTVVGVLSTNNLLSAVEIGGNAGDLGYTLIKGVRSYYTPLLQLNYSNSGFATIAANQMSIITNGTTQASFSQNAWNSFNYGIATPKIRFNYYTGDGATFEVLFGTQHETCLVGDAGYRTTAQRLMVMNTYSSSTNWEAGVFDWRTTANTLRIGTERGSTGGQARDLQLITNGTSRLTLSSNGELFTSNNLTVSGNLVCNEISSTNSANWDSNYTTVNVNSAGWTGGGSDVSTLSSNWENTFTTVNANSATWAIDTDTIYDDSLLQSTSANWDSNYTTVNANSATWAGGGSDMSTLSSNWENTFTTVNANSANWNNHTDLSLVASTSANWDSNYTTVNSNSADWNYQGTDIKSLSSNWENTFTTVNANSANWNGVYRDVWIGAGAMTPRTTNGADPQTVEFVTNDVNLDVLDFDAATEEGANFVIAMPDEWDRGTIKVKVYWTASSGSGSVVFGIRAKANSDDDAIDSVYGTEQLITDTLLLADDSHISPVSAALTVGGGTPTLGDLVIFEITREVANGSDTLGVDVRLIGVSIQYKETASTISIW